MKHWYMVPVAVTLALQSYVDAQLTHERILNAEKEPQNWLTYSGGYKSWRYSSLDQIGISNASALRVKWVYQMRTTHVVETTPLVVDGVMYITEPPSNVVALDAETGRPFWRYRRALPSKINVCCGQVNRGVAVLGDRYSSARLMRTWSHWMRKPVTVLWDVAVADYRTGHSITVAPLAVKDMIVCGHQRRRVWHSRIPGCIRSPRAAAGNGASGRFRNRGNLAANRGLGRAWKTGGGPTWVTGSYDPEQNLDNLGNWQSITGLERRFKTAGTIFLGQRDCAGRRYGQVEVVFPVCPP